MTTNEIAAPSQYLDLCPDLSALVGLAFENHLFNTPHNFVSSIKGNKSSIASAVAIDQGTSFLVTRKKCPPLKTVYHDEIQKDKQGVQWQHASDASKSLQIVYKVARVRFDDQGDPLPGQQASYASILLDLIVLSHAPVRKHPNIISLIGLTWGDSGFPDACDIPIPMVEYADLGNLGDYQANKVLTGTEKLRVLLEVAEALQFLHKCSIVHGDVKSENILLFSHPSRKFTAKVSDFGFAVVGQEGHFNFLPRGTLIWAAPEVRDGTLQTEEARFSDIYSYGLLFWRVIIDGIDPLSRYFLSKDRMQRPLDAKKLVRTDEKHLGPLLQLDMVGGYAESSSWMARFSWLEELPTYEVRQALQQGGPKYHIQRISEYTGILCDEVLRMMLLKDPRKRNLNDVLTRLRDELKIGEISHIEPESITHQPQYYQLSSNIYTISWNALRTLPTSVSNHIIKQKFRKLETKRAAGETKIGDFAYGLACCTISGMGSDRQIDEKKARELLLLGANHGSTGAQAILPRFARNFGNTLGGLDQLLIKCAKWGSLAALEDLPAMNRLGYEEAKSFLRTNMCGIGAQLFRYWNPPWLMARLKTKSFVESYLENSPEAPAMIEINPRGDGLIHAAASLAQLETVKMLVLQYKIDVNQPNMQGETPLICSMRSGNIDIADWLLDHGAQVVAESTYNHETPVHWLISVEPDQSQRMAERLLEEPKNRSCLKVWANRCKYASSLVSGYKDNWDNLTEGTPLLWAVCRKRLDLVKILVTHGSDATECQPNNTYTNAITLAAFLHESDILKYLFETVFPGPRLPYTVSKEMTSTTVNGVLAGTELARTLRASIQKAIVGCDNWKMLFRFGENWRARMDETFSLLGKEFAFADFVYGIDDQRSSPLYFAAKWGYHEAVSMALKHMGGQASVNSQPTAGQWTPIFRAVRWDNKRMFYNLLDHGADPFIRISSPHRQGWLNWTLLHQAASSVIDEDLEICEKLLSLGLRPDGIDDPAYGGPAQTPLSVAIETNQFKLADVLLERGANINAICGYVNFQQVKLNYTCSILGCVIAANLRFSGPRLQYLLWSTRSSTKTPVQPDFVVVPEFGFTALHVAVIGEDMFEEASDRDPETAGEILALLLERYDTSDELNAKTMGDSMTALHLAVQREQLWAVRLLLEMDEIDMRIENVVGQTPLDVAEERLSEIENDGNMDDSAGSRAQEMLQLLKAHLD